ATPLHAAARSRRPGTAEVTRFLLERGAEINARAASGSTPLLSAAEVGHLGAVRLLTAAGADVHLPVLEAVDPRLRGRYRGYTPLMAFPRRSRNGPRGMAPTPRRGLSTITGMIPGFHAAFPMHSTGRTRLIDSGCASPVRDSGTERIISH